MGGILGSMSFGRIRFRTWVWVDFRFSFVFAQWGIGVEGGHLDFGLCFCYWLVAWMDLFFPFRFRPGVR